MGSFTMPEQPVSDITDVIDVAVESGQYMVVVWRVGADGVMHVHRTTWRFPGDRLFEAAGLLCNNIGESLQHPPRTALPAADLTAPPPLDSTADYKECTNDPPLVEPEVRIY